MTTPLLFSLIFLIPAIFLLRGKWSWIIAGYNTAPEAEKRQYNEKKLCKVVGFLLLIMSVGFAVCGIFAYFVLTGRLEESILEDVQFVFFFVALFQGIFTLWYAKKRCKK